MSMRMRLFTWLNGRRIGTDTDGNVYYQSIKPIAGTTRVRRWVMYAPGAEDASRIPPEWHGWLHHMTDAPLPDTGRRAWQKPHMPNATGTVASYRPPGHDYSGGRRSPASSDYEAWTPGT